MIDFFWVNFKIYFFYLFIVLLIYWVKCDIRKNGIFCFVYEINLLFMVYYYNDFCFKIRNCLNFFFFKIVMYNLIINNVKN